jgi:hypothetical protein
MTFVIHEYDPRSYLRHLRAISLGSTIAISTSYLRNGAKTYAGRDIRLKSELKSGLQPFSGGGRSRYAEYKNMMEWKGNQT